MALTFFSGFETGDFGEWSSVTNSPTVQGTTKKTGDYAMRCNTDTATAYVICGVSGNRQHSFYIYIVDAPSAETVILGSATISSIRLQTDRTLKAYDTGGVLRITGTTVIPLNTWTRISSSCSWGVSTILYINGVQEGTYAGNIAPSPVLGVLSAVTADLYFDDYACTSTNSTDDLGDIRVLRASPNAAGQYAEFDTISGYTNVDEVPASDADYVDDSGVEALHRECYNLQNCATIGLGGSDTIKAVNVWIRLYDNNTLQGIIVRDNSVDYTTMKAVGKAYKWTNVLYDTNAPRASAWTQDIFDAFQSGGYSEGKNDVYMSCVMDMVAFIPVTGQQWQESATVLIGVKPLVARTLGYNNLAIVLVGAKPIGVGSLAYTNLASILVGIKPIASLGLGFTALVQVGVKPIASRIIKLIRTASVLVGVKPIASRVMGWANIATVLIGIKPIASWGEKWLETALVYVGIKPIASRIFSYSNLASVLIGVKPVATRIISLVRTASVLVGVKATGIVSWVQQWVETALVYIGVKPIASRTLSLTRSAIVLIGIKPITTRIMSYIHTATAQIGVKPIASRVLSFTNTASVLVGVKPIASRLISLSRTALVKVGIVASASEVFTVLILRFIEITLNLYSRAATLNLYARSLTIDLPARATTLALYGRSIITNLYERVISILMRTKE